MIDPYDLTKPWNTARVQEWILFGICVAGKPADITAFKLDKFLHPRLGRSPFEVTQKYITEGILEDRLREARLGQYRRIGVAFREVVVKVPDAVNTTVQELESVKGLGPKTARMILLYTQPNLKIAVLDTHILKWLRAQGYGAPKGTPSGKLYAFWETVVLREAAEHQMTPKEFDTWIWKSYARPQKLSASN